MRVKGYGVTVPHLASVPADLLASFSQTHKEVVVTISPTATPHSDEVATVAAIVSVARVRVEGDEDTDIVVSIRLQLSINSNNGEIRASFYQTRPRKLRLARRTQPVRLTGKRRVCSPRGGPETAD